MTDREQMIRRQRVLADFGDFALRCESFDEILAEACRLVSEALETRHAKILEIQHDGQSILVRAGVGWPSGVVGRLCLEMRDHSSETYSIKVGKPVITQDISKEDRFEMAPFLKDAGVVALANVPIFLPGGEAYGLLQVDSREPRNFDEQDTEFLRTYATLLGPVIDRLQKVHRLRTTEERFRLVVESARDYAIFVADPEDRITDWFPGAETIFGWTAAEALGQPGSILFTPEDRERHKDAEEVETARREGVAPNRRWHLRKDGARVFIDGTVTALRSRDGGLRGFLKIGQDTTERGRTEERLRKSEERLRALVTATSDVIYRMSPDWAEMRRLDGRGVLADTESPNRTWMDEYIHPDDQRLVRDAIQQAISTKGIFELEHRVRQADGSLGWTLSRAVPLLDDRGEIREWFGAASDVTARKRAEEALRESEARYRTLFQAMDQGYLLADVEFDAAGAPVDIRYAEANPAAIRMLGTDPTGRRLRDIDPGYEAYWYEIWGRVARTGTGERRQRYATPTGTWYDFYVFKPAPEDPESRRVAVVFRDVTAQKYAEAELRESEARLAVERARLETLVNNLPVGVGFLDPDGRMLLSNPAFQAYLPEGAIPSKMPGAEEQWVGHDEQGRRVSPEHFPAARALRGMTVLGAEFLHRSLDGAERWVRVGGVPLHDASGRSAGALAFIVDIDAEKRAQAALARLNDTLEHRVAERTAELMAAEESLRQAQKMEAVGQLTGGIAHDFNNMLQGVAGAIEMARSRVTVGRAGEAGRYLDAAQEATKRAAGLTRRLLAFARRQRLEPRLVDADGLVAGLADLVRRTMGPAIGVELRLRDGAGSVLCDPNELESAILNLCINARDAMPEGGRLAIGTEDVHLTAGGILNGEAEPGRYLAISVADTGTGMPPEVLERVFDPFFTTKPQGQGTGLGLSQVYGFVRQSGGLVRIESAPKRGTTVHLLLPLREPVAAPEEPAVMLPLRVGTRGTVLLVDDEDAVRQPAAERLRELGYAVLEARDGPEALRVLVTTRPDLLVTDVGLPRGMNGRQVAEAVRERLPGLPVLFITGYAGTSLPAGIEVIDKPFELDTLVRRVQALLEAVS